MSTAMSSRHLEALAAVCDAGSFDDAAAQLRVSPSALSQRISALERDLGQVVVRRSRPVEPTQAGEVVLRAARQTLLVHAEARAELVSGAGSADEALPVPVSLAVNADSLGTWFIPVLEAVAQEQFADIHLVLDDEDRTERLLRSGDVMAAVTTASRPVQGCRTTPLGDMRYVAVAAPALLQRRGVTALEPGVLGRLPMLQFDGVDELAATMLRLAGETEVERSHLVPSSADFVTGLRIGLGWGVAPMAQVEGMVASGELVRLVPDHAVDVALYWQRWRLASPTLDRVSEHVERAARRGLVAKSATPGGVGP